MSEELKPCPYCGYADIRRHQFGDFRAVTCCTECGVAVIGGDWHRRAQPAAQAVPEEWQDGYRAAMNNAGWGVRELYVKHQHHHGVDGLLQRCKELEQVFIREADAMLAAAPTPPAGGCLVADRKMSLQEARQWVEELGPEYRLPSSEDMK